MSLDLVIVVACEVNSPLYLLSVIVLSFSQSLNLQLREEMICYTDSQNWLC